MPTTVLGLARSQIVATGNSTIGVFGGGTTGSTSNYTDKYTFANDSVGAGTVLAQGRLGIAATSSQPGNL